MVMEAVVAGRWRGTRLAWASVRTLELSAGRRGGGAALRHKEEVESWRSEWQLWRLFLTVALPGRRSCLPRLPCCSGLSISSKLLYSW